MSKLVGITGKARSGKDAIAQQLWGRQGYTRIAFADPLKQAAQAIFGLTHAQTWLDAEKEVMIPRWNLTPRQMFQKLGTESVRDVFGEHVWLERWLISYQLLASTDDIVVPDVRFQNEADLIRSLSGVIIEVRRGDGLTGEDGSHRSEAGGIKPDYVVENDGTLEGLYQKVIAIVGGA